MKDKAKNSRRFSRLAALTQGAAIVGTLVGCDRTTSGAPPVEAPVLTPQAGQPDAAGASTVTSTPAATPVDPATDAGAAPAIPTRRLPIPNAPPGRFRLGGDSGGAP